MKVGRVELSLKQASKEKQLTVKETHFNSICAFEFLFFLNAFPTDIPPFHFHTL